MSSGPKTSVPPTALNRRAFLRRAGLGAAAGPALVRAAVAASARPPGAIRRELFLRSPKAGTAVLAATYYTRREGLELISMHQLMARSDTVDIAYFRHSPDNGRTWTGESEIPALEVRPDGKFRRALRSALVDPHTGRFVRFRIEGLLPGDDPLEGMRRWVVGYSVSGDGGHTWSVDEQIIHRGPGYSAAHSLPGVFTGKNCVMVGDIASVPLALADGTILLPVMITPLGPDGTYYNPGGGYTYSDAAVLRGRWRSDGRLEWELSSIIKVDPALSTRGMDEPTLAPLDDGRLIIVLRGSNDKKPALPGRRWIAQSADGGRTWSEPKPWTYAGGESFFSPSACSQLVPHSSGRIFWLGNISPENPVGNRPRYPFVIGEVDRRSGLLLKPSVRVVDTRGATDSGWLSLSNFSAREDRETGGIALNLSRLLQNSRGDELDWTSDAGLYRIPLE